MGKVIMVLRKKFPQSRTENAMTDNQINAMMLVIGQSLERADWPNMSAAEADAWRRNKATTRGRAFDLLLAAGR